MKKRYIVLREDDLYALQQAVCEHIRQGYTPQGGIAVDQQGFYLQAMVDNPDSEDW